MTYSRLTVGKRELDRDAADLEFRVQVGLEEVRRLARTGQATEARSAAHNLQRARASLSRLRSAEGRLQSMADKVALISATQSTTEAMKTMVKGMAMLNREVDLPQLMALTTELEKQAIVFELKDSMLDTALEDDDDVPDDEPTGYTTGDQMYAVCCNINVPRDELVDSILAESELALASAFSRTPVGEPCTLPLVSSSHINSKK